MVVKANDDMIVLSVVDTIVIIVTGLTRVTVADPVAEFGGGQET